MVNLDQLEVSLVALLPADGTPVPVKQLADLTAASRLDVLLALSLQVRSGSVAHDEDSDTYRYVKRGSGLPAFSSRPNGGITALKGHP